MRRKNYLFFVGLLIVSTLIFGGCNSAKSEKKNEVKTENPQTNKQENTKNEESNQNVEPNNNDVNNSKTEEESPLTTINYTTKDEVLFDNDKCKFVVKNINVDDLSGAKLNIYLENKTDKSVIFTTSNTSVNGYMLDPIFYEELEPNTNKVGTILFSSSNLEKANITTLDEIQFQINAHYSDNYDAKAALINDTFSLYPTGKKAGEVDYIPRTAADTDKTILEEKDVKFVVVGLKKDDFMGPSLEFYIENNSDKTLNLTEQDVTVNNTSLDTLSSTTISPGKKVYSFMYFAPNELKKNKITDIKDVKFKIKVSDYSDPANWVLEPILKKEVSYTVN